MTIRQALDAMTALDMLNMLGVLSKSASRDIKNRIGNGLKADGFDRNDALERLNKRAAKVAEENDRESVVWHRAKDELPQPCQTVIFAKKDMPHYAQTKCIGYYSNGRFWAYGGECYMPYSKEMVTYWTEAPILHSA